MFDAMRSKFHKKCKSLLKLSKTRLETVKKKKFAVYKYLKNDLAELLRNGLDLNAYGRVEGFLAEKNIAFCYEYLEQCVSTIYSQLSNTKNQRECPSECREAVATLMHAAPRFADLPEVRELRTIFSERFGSSLESFVSKEFVARLSPEPPSQERKIQILEEVAQEFSILWDPRSLRKQLFKTAPPAQGKPVRGAVYDSSDDGYNQHEKNNDSLPVTDSQNGDKKLSDERGSNVPTSNIRKDELYDRYNVPSKSEDEALSNHRRRDSSTSQDSQRTGSSSVGNFSEDEVDSSKPVHYGLIPPYVKHRNAKGGSNVMEPTRSNYNSNAQQRKYKDPPYTKSSLKLPSVGEVAGNNLKQPPGHEMGSNGMAHKVSPRLQATLNDVGDLSDEEEKKMDQLLMHYSKKKAYPLPGQETDDTYGATMHLNARANQYAPTRHESDDTYGTNKPRHRNARTDHYPPRQEGTDTYGPARHLSSRGNVYPPGNQYKETDGVARHKNAESEAAATAAAAGRPSSKSPELNSNYEESEKHAEANLLQPEMLAGHVHPKLPDYDDLTARLAALRGR